MGTTNILGNLAGGYAQGRNARKANARQDKSNELMKTLITQKAQPAQGVGGTPVTSTGKEISNDAGITTGPNQPRSLGQKIGAGLEKGVKGILGFKKGGRITKSGVAFVHSGETIIPAKKSEERKPLRLSARKSGRR
jgi:hypothetical protein